MKKIFSLFAAALLVAPILANTETHPASTDSNDTIVGVSYTILGTYNAGTGNQCGTMNAKGVKFRANRNGNVLVFDVNEGYKITAITIVGNTNSNNQVNTVDSITVDGVHVTGYDNNIIPAKNASSSDTIALASIAAIDNITLHFANPNASQINLQYSITYETRIMATDVATLSSISVDGTPVVGFNSDSLNYNVELPYGATVVPTVTATPTQSNEHVNITPAVSVPGATTIAVSSADSTVSLTYTVNFTVSTVQSTDATLNSLKVSNKAVSGFRADSLTYTYSVAYLDTVIPQISAELNDETASLIITQATAVPGAATVLVTAQAGNTLTYTVNFVRLDAEKNVKEIMMNNWYYAYQINDSAHLDTIYAHYVAGTPQPTIYNYVVSEGASFAADNNQIVVTGADNTTRTIPFAVTPVTPYVAGNDTIWFDGSENYVICPYGFDTSKGGFKFSKTDTDYSREWAGKTHVDIFLTEADSIYLIGGNTTNRKVKVRINDVVTAEGNLGSSANMWVPVRRSAPFCMSIISSQSSGDGAVKGIVVVHVAQGFTGCRDIQSEDTVRKYIRNGEIVIERNGIIYSVTGQKR